MEASPCEGDALSLGVDALADASKNLRARRENDGVVTPRKRKEQKWGQSECVGNVGLTRVSAKCRQLFAQLWRGIGDSVQSGYVVTLESYLEAGAGSSILGLRR